MFATTIFKFIPNQQMIPKTLREEKWLPGGILKKFYLENSRELSRK